MRLRECALIILAISLSSPSGFGNPPAKAVSFQPSAQRAPIGHLALSGQATMAWHSNLLLRDKALGQFAPIESDWVGEFRPSLAARFGDDAALVEISAIAGLSMVRLAQLDTYDQDSPFMKLGGRIETARMAAGLTASYDSSALPSQDFRVDQGRIERSLWKCRIDGTHDLSEATDLFAAMDLWRVAYAGRGWLPQAQQVIGAMIEVRRHATERLFLGPGLRMRWREIGRESLEDATAYLSAAWEASEDLSVTLRAGFGETSSNRAGLKSEFGHLEIEGHRSVRENLRLILRAGRDLYADVRGQLNERDSASLDILLNSSEINTTSFSLAGNRQKSVAGGPRRDQMSLTFAEQWQVTESVQVFISAQGIWERGGGFGEEYDGAVITLGCSANW